MIIMKTSDNYRLDSIVRQLDPDPIGRCLQQQKRTQNILFTSILEKNTCFLQDHKGEPYNFGANFHGYGKSLVKGMNLRFKNTETETKIDFRLNDPFVEKFKVLCQAAEALDIQEKQELLKQFGFTNKDHTLTITNSNNTQSIVEITGVGRLNIFHCAKELSFSTTNYLKHGNIEIFLNTGTSISDLYRFLSIFGLQSVLELSSEEDIKRLKTALIYRSHVPREGTIFCKSEQFLLSPISEIRKEIIQTSPIMKEKLSDEELKKVTPRVIVPGRVRYGDSRLGDSIKTQKVSSLSAVITESRGCNNDTETEIEFERIASILKLGMLSSSFRSYGGVTGNGLTRGHDAVFLQLNTPSNPDTTTTGYYSSWSKLSIKVSPTVLDRFTYQFKDDYYGVRGKHPYYLNRPTIHKLTQKVLSTPDKYSGHEVMVKERVPPKLITGIEIDGESTKNKLLQFLRKKNLIKKTENGEEVINETPVNQFITVCKSNKPIHSQNRNRHRKLSARL